MVEREERALELRIRDRRLLDVVDASAPLERVATGFRFVEGPVWQRAQNRLIFSDILGDCLYSWREGELQMMRSPSHMANGNTLDGEGRLITCEHATSRLTRTEHDGHVTVLASHYKGLELNSPNDVVVGSDGSIYFTDPNSGRRAPYGVPRPQQLPFQGVFRLEPATGELTLLVDDFEKPNGLCFSPDERTLFIADTERYHIRAYDVWPDGRLANGRLWAEVRGDGVGKPDGMKVDIMGNLFCAGPGGVHVFDASGVPLGVILLPEHTTNMAWGDEDEHSLFITAATSVYRLRTRIGGRAPGP